MHVIIHLEFIILHFFSGDSPVQSYIILCIKYSYTIIKYHSVEITVYIICNTYFRWMYKKHKQIEKSEDFEEKQALSEEHNREHL